jgi:hypothetical protein
MQIYCGNGINEEISTPVFRNQNEIRNLNSSASKCNRKNHFGTCSCMTIKTAVQLRNIHSEEEQIKDVEYRIPEERVPI